MTKRAFHKKQRENEGAKQKEEAVTNPLQQETEDRLQALDTVLSPFWSVRWSR